MKKSRDKKEIKKTLEDNRYGDLIPGDIVEGNGERYLYSYLSKNGVEGFTNMPTAIFLKATHYKTPNTEYYYDPSNGRFGEIEIKDDKGNIILTRLKAKEINKVGHRSKLELLTKI